MRKLETFKKVEEYLSKINAENVEWMTVREEDERTIFKISTWKSST